MAKPSPKRLNHVIFLGAGASYTSGYPIGQKLRLMMASKDYFQAELDKIYPTTNSMTDASLHDGKIKCLQYFDRFAKSIELFRHGGFATVDEFSKLVSESCPEHVQAMKKLIKSDKLALELNMRAVYFKNALEQLRKRFAPGAFSYGGCIGEREFPASPKGGVKTGIYREFLPASG
jgi:hypothetical protein